MEDEAAGPKREATENEDPERGKPPLTLRSTASRPGGGAAGSERSGVGRSR
jgi:hypothetical protein